MLSTFNFKFRNIGQGLFYTGISSDYSFVYDCGSESKRGFLNAAIEQFSDELLEISGRRKLDLLMLSHLDNDHVNGLEKLLEELEVHTVVLPYLTPLERLLIAYKSNEKDAAYYEFLKAPFEYLLNKGVQQIIVLTGEEESDNSLDENIEGDMENAFDQLEDSEKENSIRIEELIDGEMGFENLKFKKRGNVKMKIGWEFSLFNYDNNEETRRIFSGVFHSKSNKQFSKKDLVDILSDKQKLSAFRKDYKEVIKNKLSNKRISEINNSSLVLLHRPLNSCVETDVLLMKKQKSCEIEKDISLKRRNTWYLHEEINKTGNMYLFENSGMSRNHHRILKGSLLFGDIDVRKDLNQILNFFGGKIEEVGIVLVPHHGSKNNWDNELLNVGNAMAKIVWVVSAGYNNKYSHPHAEVVLPIILKSSYNKMLISNEFHEIEYGSFTYW